jgi:hypothetical protein
MPPGFSDHRCRLAATMTASLRSPHRTATRRNRQGRPYSYYVCSHDPTNPRLAAAHPTIPASPSARKPSATPSPRSSPSGSWDPTETAGHLRKQLARIDAAAQAYRARIRARYAGLYDERTRAETALQTAETAATQADDPTLLDELPLGVVPRTA